MRPTMATWGLAVSAVGVLLGTAILMLVPTEARSEQVLAESHSEIRSWGLSLSHFTPAGPQPGKLTHSLGSTKTFLQLGLAAPMAKQQQDTLTSGLASSGMAKGALLRMGLLDSNPDTRINELAATLLAHVTPDRLQGGLLAHVDIPRDAAMQVSQERAKAEDLGDLDFTQAVENLVGLSAAHPLSHAGAVSVNVLSKRNNALSAVLPQDASVRRDAGNFLNKLPIHARPKFLSELSAHALRIGESYSDKRAEKGSSGGRIVVSGSTAQATGSNGGQMQVSGSVIGAKMSVNTGVAGLQHAGLDVTIATGNRPAAIAPVPGAQYDEDPDEHETYAIEPSPRSQGLDSHSDELRLSTKDISHSDVGPLLDDVSSYSVQLSPYFAEVRPYADELSLYSDSLDLYSDGSSSSSDDLKIVTGTEGGSGGDILTPFARYQKDPAGEVIVNAAELDQYLYERESDHEVHVPGTTRDMDSRLPRGPVDAYPTVRASHKVLRGQAPDAEARGKAPLAVLHGKGPRLTGPSSASLADQRALALDAWVHLSMLERQAGGAPSATLEEPTARMSISRRLLRGLPRVSTAATIPASLAVRGAREARSRALLGRQAGAAADSQPATLAGLKVPQRLPRRLLGL